MKFEQKIGSWSIKQLLSFHQNGKVNLNPGFQRRSVWSATQQRELIQSLLNNMPVPTIFLWERKEGNKVIFDVIDGKQRSEAILAFTKKKNPLSVKIDPEDDPDWNWNAPAHWTWKEVAQYAPKKRKAFLAYRIPTVTVRGDLSDIERLFVKLNSTGSKLTRAEILNAKMYSASVLLKVSNRLAQDMNDYFVGAGILGAGQISRMKAVEFIAELLLSMEKDNVLNKKSALDSVMSHTQIAEARLNELARQLRSTFSYIAKYFPDVKSTRFRKIPDFYVLTFAFWRLAKNGYAIKRQTRAELAFLLLKKLSVDIAKGNAAYEQGKGMRLPSPAREYHLTVASGSDSFNHRQQRLRIIEDLITPIFDAKASRRTFSDAQKQLLWHSAKTVTCTYCRQPILGWDDAEVDHIFPYARGGATSLKNGQLLHATCNRILGVKRS